MSAQSRLKRFQGHRVTKVSLDVNCDQAGEGNCKVLLVGTSEWFYVNKKVTTETEMVQVRGKALFLSYHLMSGLGSSVSCVPSYSICLEL